MKKLLLQLLCLVNLIVLHHAVEFDVADPNNQQAYDIKGLISKIVSRLHHSSRLNEESPNVIADLQFSGLNLDNGLEEYGDLWQNTSKCAEDILYILFNIKNQWAFSLIDSFGKPESGILKGNFKWVGDYNECIQVRSTNPNSTVGNFRGKYCSLQWSLPAPVLNTSIPLPFVTGICVPDSCSSTQLQSVMQFSHITGSVPSLNATASGLHASISCKATERPLNAATKGVIALLSIFCTLAVVGSSLTVAKYFKDVIVKTEPRRPSLVIVNVSEGGHHVVADGKSYDKDDQSLIRDINVSANKEPNKLEAILNCFCVFTNGAKLLNTDSSEGQLLCIHGIRFLSMSWVILGHSYAFGFQQMRNPMEAVTLIDNFAFQAIIQGFYSVDSFFVLSGFLLTFLTMKEMSKTRGVIPWAYFYIHRYIRLTPIYMVILGFSATVYLYLGSGPFWPDNTIDAMCRDSWWWNLLYINNFAKMTEQCMGWSWYLANDMQFFVISPLFLITLWRWPKIGYGLIGTFLCACWLSNFFITYHFGLFTGMSEFIGNPNIQDFGQAMLKYVDYFDKIYIKPYTRISPYLIGMLVGYLLFKHQASNRPKYSWVFLCVGWIIATTITLACVYGMYHRHPSVIGSSFFNALHQTTFAVGLTWVMFVCLIGQGGFVNSILSYKLFIPLSRLTYTAYLIHPMIITGYLASMKTSFEFSHPTVVFVYLGVMLATYGLSLPVALILESPIVSLEKLVRKSFTRRESG